MESSDDWCVNCSDDEKYGVTSQTSWKPPVNDIVKLYTILDRTRDEAFELEWQCPGRRGPSPTPEEQQEEYKASLDSIAKDEKDDFDFMDEMSATKFTRTSGGGPKGSAKKKTTSLDGILSNMRRHRIMDQSEMIKSTTNNK